MKEYPILFSAPMARAIREGRKTQTRRIINERHLWKWTGREEHMMDLLLMCPYGVPGDRLWVKETYSFGKGWDGLPAICVTKGEQTWYHADGTTLGGEQLPTSYGRVRPSIHMPRWASRITLEVVSRRVEHVEDITEADAIAEGFSESFDSAGGCHERTTACENFLYTFYDLNERAPRGSNPWVWVVEFRRLSV